MHTLHASWGWGKRSVPCALPCHLLATGDKLPWPYLLQWLLAAGPHLDKLYRYIIMFWKLLCSLLPDMYQRSTLFLFHSTRVKASWGETLWVLRRLQNGPILHKLMCSRIHIHCGMTGVLWDDRSLGSILFFSRTEDPQFSPLLYCWGPLFPPDALMDASKT